ncbi:hypothetical protein H9P43_000143 [Blastocladiella emersonii ATCC 22665]|nr:hypothetical protein H9P43_000143 [Blastocladiella emersonii ATCC 22665]
MFPLLRVVARPIVGQQYPKFGFRFTYELAVYLRIAEVNRRLCDPATAQSTRQVLRQLFRLYRPPFTQWFSNDSPRIPLIGDVVYHCEKGVPSRPWQKIAQTNGPKLGLRNWLHTLETNAEARTFSLAARARIEPCIRLGAHGMLYNYMNGEFAPSCPPLWLLPLHQDETLEMRAAVVCVTELSPDLCRDSLPLAPLDPALEVATATLVPQSTATLMLMISADSATMALDAARLELGQTARIVAIRNAAIHYSFGLITDRPLPKQWGEDLSSVFLHFARKLPVRLPRHRVLVVADATSGDTAPMAERESHHALRSHLESLQAPQLKAQLTRLVSLFALDPNRYPSYSRAAIAKIVAAHDPSRGPIYDDPPEDLDGEDCERPSSALSFASAVSMLGEPPTRAVWAWAASLGLGLEGDRFAAPSVGAGTADGDPRPVGSKLRLLDRDYRAVPAISLAFPSTRDQFKSRKLVRFFHAVQRAVEAHTVLGDAAVEVDADRTVWPGDDLAVVAHDDTAARLARVKARYGAKIHAIAATVAGLAGDKRRALVVCQSPVLAALIAKAINTVPDLLAVDASSPDPRLRNAAITVFHGNKLVTAMVLSLNDEGGAAYAPPPLPGQICGVSHVIFAHPLLGETGAE